MTATQKRNAQKKRAKETKRAAVANALETELATSFTLDVRHGRVVIRKCWGTSERILLKSQLPTFSTHEVAQAGPFSCSQCKAFDYVCELYGTQITSIYVQWEYGYESFDFSSLSFGSIFKAVHHANLARELHDDEAGLRLPAYFTLYDGNGNEVDKWLGQVDVGDVVAAVAEDL